MEPAVGSEGLGNRHAPALSPQLGYFQDPGETCGRGWKLAPTVIAVVRNMTAVKVASVAAVTIALAACIVDAQQTDARHGDRRLADEITTLPVGAPLRVNAHCITCVQSRGPFFRATDDTLWLGTNRSTQAIPAGEIVSLDILASSRWAGASRGMMLGFLAGGLVGAVIGASTDQNSGVPSRGASAMVGTAVFGAAGAVVGAVTGFVTRGEKWHPLPPPRPPT